jgi:hypothetical protein
MWKWGQRTSSPATKPISSVIAPTRDRLRQEGRECADCRRDRDACGQPEFRYSQGEALVFLGNAPQKDHRSSPQEVSSCLPDISGGGCWIIGTDPGGRGGWGQRMKTGQIGDRPRREGTENARGRNRDRPRPFRYRRFRALLVLAGGVIGRRGIRPSVFRPSGWI